MKRIGDASDLIQINLLVDPSNEIGGQRSGKKDLLSKLRDDGVFLIDLKRDPVDESSLDECVPDLVRRCKRLHPDRIILIKANVYDVAFSALGEANLPVVNERIPFPCSGQQKRFEKVFASALKKEAEGQGALDELLALSSGRTSCSAPCRSCRRAAVGRLRRRG